jgi:SRSO17 transposase
MYRHPYKGLFSRTGGRRQVEGIVVACPATGRRASQSAFAAAASASAWCSPYRLYGESGDVTRALYRLKLPSAVAIRSNHLVRMFSGERMRHTRWRLYDCVFADGSSERRCCARSSSAGGSPTRYSQLTIDRCVNRRRRSGRSKPTCQATSAQCRQHGWSAHARPAYSFNQAKDELGWADYRLTDAHSIERWWELLTLCGG